ncbi:hypothetical protein PtB15_10B160 [Puccinia triticina]|nr:hypothetical protein PtB15_10B160 [Puccinia triticina]
MAKQVGDRALLGSNRTLCQDVNEERAALPTNAKVTARIAEINAKQNDSNTNADTNANADTSINSGLE